MKVFVRSNVCPDPLKWGLGSKLTEILTTSRVNSLPVWNHYSIGAIANVHLAIPRV